MQSFSFKDFDYMLAPYQLVINKIVRIRFYKFTYCHKNWFPDEALIYL
jgi:hypothetical protein